MRTNTKWFSAIAATGLLALSGLALGLGSTAEAAPRTVTITWYASPITNLGLRQALIAAFEKQYPHIKVKLQNASTDENTNRATLVTVLSSGSSTPDVYDGDVIWPAQFANAGLALPLSQHLPKAFWKRFAPGLVAGATYKGKVYGAPFFMDAGFLYYRRDLLQKEHLPVPHTWAQLVHDSKVLEHAHLVRYGYVWEGDSYEGLTCDWMEVFTDAGGKVFNPANNSVLINSPAGRKALTFLRGLITSGVSPKAVTTYQEPDAMSAFAAGEAAFLRNWDYAWAYSQSPKTSKVVNKVGVAPLPTFNVGKYPGYSTVGGWNIYINPHSKHLAQDLTFLKWITGPRAQTIMATRYSEIPTNYGVQKNPAVRKLNPVLGIVSHVRLITRPANTPKYPTISQAIYTNINAALAGSMSVQAALAQAAQQIKQALSGAL
jgi:multiple sugar transport system substrate-binding protein